MLFAALSCWDLPCHYCWLGHNLPVTDWPTVLEYVISTEKLIQTNMSFDVLINLYDIDVDYIDLDHMNGNSKKKTKLKKNKMKRWTTNNKKKKANKIVAASLVTQFTYLQLGVIP